MFDPNVLWEWAPPTINWVISQFSNPWVASAGSVIGTGLVRYGGPLALRSIVYAWGARGRARDAKLLTREVDLADDRLKLLSPSMNPDEDMYVFVSREIVQAHHDNPDPLSLQEVIRKALLSLVSTVVTCKGKPVKERVEQLDDAIELFVGENWTGAKREKAKREAAEHANDPAGSQPLGNLIEVSGISLAEMRRHLKGDLTASSLPLPDTQQLAAQVYRTLLQNQELPDRPHDIVARFVRKGKETATALYDGYFPKGGTGTRTAAGSPSGNHRRELEPAGT
jgi:hypothetical protein